MSPLVITLLALLAAAVMAIGVGRAAGMRWFDVTTPSMGTTAPVGTLLVTRPASTAGLTPGRFIVFRNPTGHVYSHRVVRNVAGAISTRGDINGSVDPWTIHQANVIGQVAWRVPYGGYVLRGMPWLVGGLVVSWLLLALVVPRRWHHRARFLFGIATVDIATIMVHPFTGAVAMGYRPVSRGMQAIVVATGIFPQRITGLGGTHVDLLQGHVGLPIAERVNRHGAYEFTPTLHLTWPWWVGVVAVSLLPLAWSWFVGFDEEDPAAPDRGDDDADRAGGPPSDPGESAFGGSSRAGGTLATWFADRRAIRCAGALAAASAMLVGIAMPNPAWGKFTASVTNTGDTAGSRTYFTCLDAMDHYTRFTSGGKQVTGNLYTGYALGDGTGVSGSTDQGVVGPYKLTTTNVTQTTDVGCTSDYRVRSQKALVLNGKSTIDLDSGSSISTITGDPGNSNNMTWQVWFKTTTKTGGILACSANSSSVCGDRSTWMASNGQVVFGVNSTELVSPTALNDGAWHMVVTQLGSAGMKMWVDGVLKASNTSVTSGSGTIQYPQFGYSAGTLPSGLANQPSTLYFTGEMQMVAVYGRYNNAQLGDADVQALYQSAAA